MKRQRNEDGNVLQCAGFAKNVTEKTTEGLES